MKRAGVVMASTWTRWIPATLVPVVVIAGAVLMPMAADATPVLPEKSPAQLLEFIAGSADTSYSGTIQQSSNLGLPDLSTLGSSYGGGSGSGSDSPVSMAVQLLTGTNTARVFVGGADTARIQVLDTLAQRDVIRNGAEVWTYDSKTNAVQHISAPDGARPDVGITKTPAELATQLLATLDESTSVTVTDTARVAGRAVYPLVLTPRDDTTLVGSVILSVDSETGLPLDVQLFAAEQSEPAFSVGFSAIDFTAPDASLFTFTPPAGATVDERQLGAGQLDERQLGAGQLNERQLGAGQLDERQLGAGSGAALDSRDAAKPEVSGAGWGSIVELPAGSAGDTGAAGDPAASRLLDQVLTPVSDGRALQTSLISVLLTTDGRVFIGAVSVAQLQAAAAT